MYKPEPGTYPSYYEPYINRVPFEDMIEALREGLKTTQEAFVNLPVEKEDYRYAEGKWSVKELLGHMIDVERVMSYRAMCISRGEKISLPGFNENEYVRQGGFNGRAMMSLLDEFTHLRLANIALFSSLTDEQAARVGTANEKPITARALVALMAGHELHHVKVLKERYL